MIAAVLTAFVVGGCTDDIAAGSADICTVDNDCGEDWECVDGDCVPRGNDDNQDNHNGNDTNQQNQQGDDADDGDRRDDGDYDETCTYVDRADTFEPDEIWSFQVDDTLPYAEYEGHGGDAIYAGHSMDQVMMTPVVIDLDDNGIPDVVFTTFATNENDDGWDQLVTGVLRAVDGAAGNHKWSVGYQELGALDAFDDDNPALGFMPGGSVAAGDINGDGTPEVVAPVWDYSADVGEGAQGLVAIDHQGQVLWASDDASPRDIEHWWGGPSLTDLSGDGDVEIVVGASVYDSDGRFLWNGRDHFGDGGELERDPGTGSNFAPTDASGQRLGPLSVVADLDGSSTREVVTGRAAFSHDGMVLWEADDDDVAGDATLDEGYPGVADFDGSGTADVVVVSAGTVRIHDGANGDLLWGPVDVPDAGRLGPPTIADMTGDGVPEIGVAGSERYIVLAVDSQHYASGMTPTFNDTLVWQQDTQDLSSNTTGSSVFDFNGDGEASIVYNDELLVRVFDGPTGDVIFEAENPSVTALDNPVIADVNNDGAANIVVPSADFECGAMFDECDQALAGLRVFGDADDNWVTTRRIWNQHAYSINHVDEDGTIPADPTPNYLDHNTFRLNKLTEIEAQAAPDLLAEEPTIDIGSACGFEIGFWVSNRGAIQVGPGIPVSVYAERDGERQLLASGETGAGLAPGESEYVELEGAASLSGDGWTIAVVVDDDNGQSTRNECDDDNNRIVVADDISC